MVGISRAEGDGGRAGADVAGTSSDGQIAMPTMSTDSIDWAKGTGHGSGSTGGIGRCGAQAGGVTRASRGVGDSPTDNSGQCSAANFDRAQNTGSGSGGTGGVGKHGTRAGNGPVGTGSVGVGAAGDGGLAWANGARADTGKGRDCNMGQGTANGRANQAAAADVGHGWA